MSGYKNIAVAKLLAPEDQLLEPNNLEAARRNKSCGFVNGYPVVGRLTALTDMLQVFPGIKFYAHSEHCRLQRFTDLSGNSFSSVAASELFVCIDDDPYAVMRIGFDNYRCTNGKNTFAVYARDIRNAKYHPTREQYFMSMFLDPNKAFKVAVANMRVHSTEELARLRYRKFYNRSTDVSNHKARELGALLDSITQPVLIREIRAAVAAGYQFSTPEFTSVAASLEDAVATTTQATQRRVDATYVRFMQGEGGMIARMASTSNVRKTYAPEPKDQGVVPLNEVPAFIQEKVAVLQTLEPDNYIDGVGMKVTDYEYWVEN